jgi:hypothetical protein
MKIMVFVNMASMVQVIANGVNPIDVSIDSPPSIAAIEAPLPI